MREIGIDELKTIQLDMLKDIHSFCVSHDIKYSLAFGSLLGAIRHKGYIPWDDDIDIMMRRDEYERFITTYGNDRYKIADLSVNPDYGLPFAKVEDVRTIMHEMVEGTTEYGIYIDVFPVDNIPDDIFQRQVFYQKKNFWNVLYNLKVIKVRRGRSMAKNAILMLAHILLRPIKRTYIVRKMSQIAQSYNVAKTIDVGIVVPADSRIEEAIPSSSFNEYIICKFEDAEVQTIGEYDKYLKAAYGDYMQLPPVEKRVSHHVFEAYWKLI